MYLTKNMLCELESHGGFVANKSYLLRGRRECGLEVSYQRVEPQRPWGVPGPLQPGRQESDMEGV